MLPRKRFENLHMLLQPRCLLKAQLLAPLLQSRDEGRLQVLLLLGSEGCALLRKGQLVPAQSQARQLIG